MKILSKRMRIIIGVSLLVLSLMVIVCFIKFGSFLAFLFVYPYALTEITGFGINPFLAKILAVVTAIVFLGIIGLIFSWGKKRRLVGFSLLALLFILHTLAMFLVSRERFFDLDGQPLKYCSRDCVTDKLDCADVPGYDKCGQERHAITLEEAKELEAEKISENNKLSLGSGEIPCWEVRNWFNAKTGEALIYYENDAQENFYCYIQPGFSGISGKKRIPVDAESVAKIKTFATAKYLEMENQKREEAILENEPSAPNPAVIAVGEGFVGAGGLLKNLYQNLTAKIFFIIFLNLLPWIAVLMYEKKAARIINSNTLTLAIIMTTIWLNVSFCSYLSDYGAIANIFYMISLFLFALFCLGWFVSFHIIRKNGMPLAHKSSISPNHRRCVPPETFLS